MSLAAVAAYGKGMDQKSINELCTVFHALSHGVGRELSSLQEYSVLASPHLHRHRAVARQHTAKHTKSRN